MNPNTPSAFGDILVAYLSIILEGTPFILVGTILSGLIDAFLPAKFLEKLLPKNKVLATLASGFLGLIFPVCECAVVPVIRRLVQKGLPLSCALTYMLSAPIINPVVIISTLAAFQNYKDLSGMPIAWPMLIARVTLGYLVAVIVGIALLRKKPAEILLPSIVKGIEKAESDAAQGIAHGPELFDAKLRHAMRTAMRDFLDTAMYFSAGVLITSIFNTQVNQGHFNTLAANPMLATPTMMGIAFMVALCSTSDAFIAAPIPKFDEMAKLAFLVFGPMLDVKLVFMYSTAFRRRFLIWLAIALFVLVGLLSGPWYKLIEFIFKL